MTRIGKMPISIPKGVAVTINKNDVSVIGPKGELSKAFSPDISIEEKDDSIYVSRPSDQRHHKALHGLTRALINNMVTGVSSGFSRHLEIEGVGYRAQLQGKDLVLNVGYSHPIIFQGSKEINFSVDNGGRSVAVNGIDKEVVGEIAARIRKCRPPEPYKGKGIRYQGEVIQRKAGKSGK